MHKVVPIYDASGFKGNKAATARLSEILNDPVMQEALCIIQYRLNTTLQTTMEAAALQGAYAAGAASVITALHYLAEPMESSDSPVAMTNHIMEERSAWLQSLKKN